MEKYFTITKNGRNIFCKLYCNEGAGLEKAVLFGHGFAGHKDNGAAKKFADRVMRKFILIFN